MIFISRILYYQVNLIYDLLDDYDILKYINDYQSEILDFDNVMKY